MQKNAWYSSIYSFVLLVLIMAVVVGFHCEVWQLARGGVAGPRPARVDVVKRRSDLDPRLRAVF